MKPNSHFLPCTCGPYHILISCDQVQQVFMRDSPAYQELLVAGMKVLSLSEQLSHYGSEEHFAIVLQSSNTVVALQVEAVQPVITVDEHQWLELPVANSTLELLFDQIHYRDPEYCYRIKPSFVEALCL